MSDIAFRELIGALPLDHRGFEDEGCTVEDMSVLFGVGMVGVAASEGVLPYRYHDGDTRAPIFGWFHVPTEDESARAVGTWRTGAALARTTTSAAAGAAVSAKLIGYPDFSTRDELKAMEVWMDPKGARSVPEGTSILVTRAQWEDETFLLGTVAGQLELIDQWRGKDISTFSTIVRDIDDAGKADDDFAAHLGTVWRITGRAGVAPDPGGSVTPGTSPPTYSLAWNLADVPEIHFGADLGAKGFGRGLMTGYRITAEVPFTRDLVAGIIAAQAGTWGGPICFGDGADDVHKIGTTFDGLPIVPGHIDMLALFYERFFALDGPLHSEGPGEWGADRGPLRTRVHMTFDDSIGDFGEWVWWCMTQNFQPMAGSPEHPAGTNLEMMYQGGITYQPIARWQSDLSRRFGEPLPDRPAIDAGKKARAAYKLELARVTAANAELEAEIRRRAHDNPCTVKTLGFGAEGSASEWSNASRTGYADRLPGGLVAGGSVNLPASWTLEDVDADLSLPNDATTHPTMWDVNCRVGRALANRIDRVNGTPVDAWRESIATGGDVTATPYDVDGTADPTRRWIYAGTLRTTKAVQCAPVGYSGTQTIAATDHVIIWDTSGGACAANIPTATGSGRIIIVTNLAGGANLTMTPAAGNIDGAATAVLASGSARHWVDFATNEWRKITT